MYNEMGIAFTIISTGVAENIELS
ncbi:hypothetical protein CO2235_230114 [Cupriavidus oxalaticus]|uniref:Uncharacterized protein n=1 Tax=Cupriavidus oxalaticus TaxID=96344 RepID=A0A375G5J2_9BURK|nr:hypothetical protein CO2235_230114 [Cupriavidus oxalaticus]